MKIKVNCYNCETTIYKEKSRLKLYKRQFCNIKCRAEWQSKIPPELHANYKHGLSKGSKFICLNCNKKDIRRSYKQKYCKASCQMNYEYRTGKRDRFEITKKANEHVRLHGLPKLRGKPSHMLGRTKKNGTYPEHIGFQKGKENVINKYPEKHPNYIMAQKGHRTQPERVMEELLKKRNIDFVFNKRIGTYWVDFFLPKLNMILEVDGHHWHQKENIKRENFLKSKSYIIHHWRVTKYGKLQIIKNAEYFLKGIYELNKNI